MTTAMSQREFVAMEFLIAKKVLPLPSLCFGRETTDKRSGSKVTDSTNAISTLKPTRTPKDLTLSISDKDKEKKPTHVVTEVISIGRNNFEIDAEILLWSLMFDEERTSLMTWMASVMAMVMINKIGRAHV